MFSQVWRVAHIVVSSLLPLAAYRLVRSVFRCRDTGVVAAMLAASSVFTNVVATHTLIHGFLAPILFSSLAGILSYLCPKEDSVRNASACVANPSLGYSDRKDSNCLRKEFHTSSPKENENIVLCDSSLLRMHSSELTETKDLSSLGSGNGYLKENNNVQIKDFNQKSRGCSQGRQVFAPVTRLVYLCSNALCRVVKKLIFHSLSIRKFTFLSVIFDRQSVEEIQVHQVHEKSSKSSTKSSLPSSPNPSEGTGCRPTDNNCRRIQERKATSRLTSFDWKNLSVEVTRVLKLSTYAFALSLCCYVRPDSALLIVGVVCLLVPWSHLLHAATSRRTVVGAVAGCLAGVLLGVCDDVYFYGFFTVTPWNWFWFNVASGVQAQLFGTDSIMIYLHELLWKNAGMRMLFAANVIALVLMIRPSQERTNKICFRTEKTFRFISCLLIMLVIFSLQGHKEVRFIYNAMVVYLCISAASIVSLTHMFLKKLSFRAVSVAMVTILYAVSQWLDFPTPGDLSARTWTYRESMDSYDVSRCVRFISRQTDVRGVFINKHLYTFGGYTMLGHDVPILVRTFSGYHEYGFSARTKTTSRNWFGSSKEISIATSSKVSNLFSDFNKPHLLLHLITHTEYNYLVLDVEDDFFQASFKEVYVHGPLKVLKRLGSKADETKLSALLPALKVTPSADILEKEAQELFAFGLKERADERYKEAQQIKRR